MSHFYRQRPKHIKLINDLPHNMCMCSYHANFIEAVTALNKNIPSIPSYDNGFVQKFLCPVSSIDCWYESCNNCTGISVSKINDLAQDAALDSKVSWKIWKKSVEAKRAEKQEETGTLAELIAYTASLSSQFLRHSFNKREQSEVFNMHDRPRALNVEFPEEGLLQVDFAENFVCEGQDEVQNAHWNQRQLSLFTTGFYHNDAFQAKVFVSNNLIHTKDTIVPYLWKLLSNLPASLKILKIWSDGPSSQFKNKFIASLIPQLEAEFGLKIIWNFFATSHGKGCVDGIGATVKIIVRKHIRARNIIVNSASDFVSAFKLTQSKIEVEEVTDAEFDQINQDMKVAELFSGAKNIRNISNSHQIQVIDGKSVIFCTSKVGYNKISL